MLKSKLTNCPSQDPNFKEERSGAIQVYINFNREQPVFIHIFTCSQLFHQETHLTNNFYLIVMKT